MGLEEQLEFDYAEEIDFVCRNKAQIEYMQQVRTKLEMSCNKLIRSNEFIHMYVTLGYAKEFAYDWNQKRQNGSKEMVRVQDNLGQCFTCSRKYSS